MKHLLLNPGPTNTTIKTKAAQWKGSDMCHRTESFSKALQSTKTRLLQRFGDLTFNAAVLGGSGTLAMEAMITSLLPRTPIHIINAGIYGARAIEICQSYNISYIEITAQNLGSLMPDKEVKNLLFVENETTTGENFCPHKVASLFPAARLFIDATSAFGASSYKGLFNRVGALCFCGNKCLQSTPGVAAVIYNKDLPQYKRSFYSDLSRYSSHDIPFTLPTQSIYALNSALAQKLNSAEILNDRRDRLIAALGKLNIKCVNKFPSNSIIGFQHPGLSYNQLHLFLNRKKITIYSGIPSIDRSFRIATMSNLFDKKFNYLLKALNDSCLH